MSDAAPASDHQRRLLPRESLFLGALTALVVLLVFSGVFLRGETFFYQDVADFHRPYRAMFVQIARASEGLPSWNPFLASGQPFAANPNSAAFHPFSLTFLVLPFELAFRLQVFLPLGLVFAGGFALLRDMGRSRSAAWLGSAGLTFGGFGLGTAVWFQLSHSLAFLPWALLAARRTARWGRPADAAGLALAIGLIGLGGSPSGIVAAALCLPAAALGQRLDRGDREPGTRAWPPRATCGLLLLGAVFGALIASAVVVPAARHAELTIRADPEHWTETKSEAWSFPPRRLLELVAPRVHGRIQGGDPWWGAELYEHVSGPYVLSIHAGLLIGVLAVIGGVFRWRELWPWLVVGGSSLLLSLGPHAPGLAWLREWTPLGTLRFPEKLVVPLLLVFAIAGARGFDLVLRHAGARRWAIAGLLLVAAFGASDGVQSALAPSNRVGALDCAVLAGLAAALAAALALAATRPRRAVLALVLLTAADLVVSGRELTPTCPPERVSTPPSFLQPLVTNPPPGFLFVFASHRPGKIAMDGREVSPRPPIPSQWGLRTTFEGDFDLMQYAWTRSATSFYLDFMADHPELVMPILERRSVSAILRHWPGGRGPEGAPPLELLSVPQPRALAFAVDRVETIADEAAAARVLLRLGPAARSTALLDGAQLETPIAEVSPARVESAWRSPARWELEVVADGPLPSVVAINETWSPDWKLEIDGRQARVVRSDLDLCAVIVPAGRHRLVMVHRDPSLHLGLSLGVVGLFGMLTLVGFGWTRPASESSSAAR